MINNMDRKLVISIIAYNEVEEVIRCIQTLKEQTKQLNVELVVVDNGSTDGLAGQLVDYQDISYICCDEGTKNYADLLNIIVKEFVGDNDLLIMRANYIPTTRAIENLVEALYQDETIGIVSPATNAYAELPFYVRTLEEAEVYASNEDKDSMTPDALVDGDVVLIRNELIQNNVPFSNTLYRPDKIIEDWVNQQKKFGYSYRKTSNSIFFAEKLANNYVYDMMNPSELEQRKTKLRRVLHQMGNVTYKGMEIYKLVEPEILAAINENNHLQDLNRNVLVHTFTNDKIPVTPEKMNQQTREFMEQLPEKDVLFFTLPIRRLYKGYLRHTAMEDFIGAITDDQYIDIELMFQSEDYNSPVITKNRQIVNMLTISTIYEMNTIDNDEMLQVFIKEIIAPIESVINRKLNKDIVLQCYFKLCIVLRQHKSFITFYKKVIEKVKPKVIIYSHGQDAYLSMLRDAAREMKIPTLEVDHGVSTIQKYHPGLMYSDYFLLYSKINERVCERSGNNRVIGVGKPYVYDNVACNHLDKIIIAFISSIECEIFDYAKNLAKKLNPSKYLVVYKTHSAEVWSEEEKKQEEKETPNLMFMDGFVDINDLYENVDVVVAMRTSGLFDALPYQNIKIIVAPDPAVKNSVWTLDELIEDVGKCGDFVMTRTEEELFNEVVSYKRGEIYRDKPNCFFQMDPEQRFRDITNYFMKNGKNLI